jgi:hypothetical protein
MVNLCEVLACAVVIQAQLCLAASPFIARLAFFNYPWESDGILFDDDGYLQVLESMAPLAVAMFNERRSDIIPALSNLGTCNKNLTIPYACATAGNPRIAFSHVMELAGLTDYPHVMCVWRCC